MKPRARTLAFVVLALLLGAVLWRGAHAAVMSARTRVLVFGVDAGEWDVLGPLMEQGKCPNFSRLRAEGSAGKLRSFVPLTRSPVIWTSIATGKTPEKHGIHDFYADRARKNPDTVGDEGAPLGHRPNTSNMWKARPVWDILGSLGRTVGVVGWWVTWPAQPVNGALLTDLLQYDPKQWPTGRTQMTYPESLSTMVERLRRTPESVSWAEVFQFVAPFDTTKVTQRQEQLVHSLKAIYASDMTFDRSGLELYRRNHPDFFAMYFRGVDEVCHVYWDIAVPSEAYNPPLTKAEIAWLKPLIPNYYIFTDRLLGAFLKEAGKDTDVIACSDHGFGGGGIGVLAHKPDGIIFMRGPHVIRGGTITGATVLDIAPTILALYGLPVAQDMDGRPIATGLKPDVVRRVARETRLQTYETARAKGKSEEPLRSPVDEELRERLRSLGYIQ